jgi:hypothetical protein
LPTDQGLRSADTTANKAPPRKRFVLSRHSALLDPSVHAVRDDLADVDLADRVFAPHYAQSIRYKVTKPTTVHVKPSGSSVSLGSLSNGQTVDLFDLSASWGWVRTANGIGYVRADCIVPA